MNVQIFSFGERINKCWIGIQNPTLAIDPRRSLSPAQTRVKKQETKQFSTFAVYRLRHSKQNKSAKWHSGRHTLICKKILN